VIGILLTTNAFFGLRYDLSLFAYKDDRKNARKAMLSPTISATLAATKGECTVQPVIADVRPLEVK
jgi:hypothetical protein